MKITKKMACIIGSSALVVVFAVVAVILAMNPKSDTGTNNPDVLVAASSEASDMVTAEPEINVELDDTKTPMVESVEITEAPEVEVTAEPTVEETKSPEETIAPVSSNEPTEKPTAEPVVTVEPAKTVEPAMTAEPEKTAEPTAIPQATQEPVKTAEPTATPAPTATPKVTNTPAPVVTPAPTQAPTEAPTVAPTAEPTLAPTEAPAVCNHEWVDIWYNYPTCGMQGNYTPQCVNCGEWGTSQTVDPTGHDYESTLGFEGNCSFQAVYSNVCKVCGFAGPDTYSASLHPDKHDWIETTSEVWNNDTWQWETVTGSYCGWCNKTKE